jgi:hypothetical protein
METFQALLVPFLLLTFFWHAKKSQSPAGETFTGKID